VLELKKFTLIFILCLAFAFPPANSAYAAGAAPRVAIRVEGAFETYAAGSVNANTFREALEIISEEFELILTYVQSGARYELIGVKKSVEADLDIELIQGEWSGYVGRKNEIIRQENFLELALEEGDEVVLFFGDPDGTLILSQLFFKEIEGGLVFTAGASEINWTEENGFWIPETKTIPVEGVTIRLEIPGGAITAVTDENGSCFFEAPKPSVVSYFADGYREGEAPRIVRTQRRFARHGFYGAETEATRALAVAFLMNMYAINFFAEEDEISEEITELEPEEINEAETVEAETETAEERNIPQSNVIAAAFAISERIIASGAEEFEAENEAEDENILSSLRFSDVPEGHECFFEINFAAELGIVGGYEDGTFRPDAPISLLELFVLVTRVFPELLGGDFEIEKLPDEIKEGLPEWAAPAICGIFSANLLNGIDFTDWLETATHETLASVYKNLTPLQASRYN